jgi:hypothetical protein
VTRQAYIGPRPVVRRGRLVARLAGHPFDQVRVVQVRRSLHALTDLFEERRGRG